MLNVVQRCLKGYAKAVFKYVRSFQETRFFSVFCRQRVAGLVSGRTICRESKGHHQYVPEIKPTWQDLVRVGKHISPKGGLQGTPSPPCFLCLYHRAITVISPQWTLNTYFAEQIKSLSGSDQKHRRKPSFILSSPYIPPASPGQLCFQSVSPLRPIFTPLLLPSNPSHHHPQISFC